MIVVPELPRRRTPHPALAALAEARQESRSFAHHYKRAVNE